MTGTTSSSPATVRHGHPPQVSAVVSELERVPLPVVSSTPVELPVEMLKEGHGPRVAGIEDEHVRSLVGVVAPPIVVHRPTMRVVDGVHRLRAAIAGGAARIRAVLVDGSENELFVLALRLNSLNGLPLSQDDRRSAADRLVASQPDWSDRMIAELTGLSARSVAVLRTRTTADRPRSNRRVGRDGKVRPLNAAEGRRLAARIIDEEPDVSLRSVASSAGISLGTAHDVRRRVQAGADPVPAARSVAGAATPAPPPVPLADPEAMRQRLVRDPALRQSDDGRELLRLLRVPDLSESTRTRLRASVPAHCVASVSSLARLHATAWLQLATELEAAIAETTDREPRVERPVTGADR